MRSVLTVGLVLSLALAFVSCAQPPEEELKAAQTALDSAKRAEADVYAPDAYRSAESTLKDARAKVEQKDYEVAKTAAIRAKEQADQAKSLGETNKQNTRNEAQTLINRLSTGLTDSRTALNNAPRGKGADSDLDQLSSDLGQAEASLSSARNSLVASKFKDALNQAKTAEVELSQVQGAVQTAMRRVEQWQQQHRSWYEL